MAAASGRAGSMTPAVRRLPRTLHPAAWWLWALGLAVATSRTTNPVLLALIIAVLCCVVINRRSDAPWALAFRLYIVLAGFIVVMRVGYRVIFGGGGGSTIVFTLPEIQFPGWAAGTTLFGPVSAESLLGGFYDGLRLATMVLCVGAANALANPKRLLKAVPGALYEIASAVVVALSVFPQLADSLLRVRRARKLRGGSRGVRALRAVVIPVLEDAMDRSLQLAAAMDSRGYGRLGAMPARTRLLTSGLMIGGLLGICVGIYGTLDVTAPTYLGAPMLVGGVLAGIIGLATAGRQVQRSHYRPDRWLPAEIGVALSGIGVGVALWLSASLDPLAAHPLTHPPSVPHIPLLALVGILIGLMPTFLAPAPPSQHLRHAGENAATLSPSATSSARARRADAGSEPKEEPR